MNWRAHISELADQERENQRDGRAEERERLRAPARTLGSAPGWSCGLSTEEIDRRLEAVGRMSAAEMTARYSKPKREAA